MGKVIELNKDIENGQPSTNLLPNIITKEIFYYDDQNVGSLIMSRSESGSTVTASVVCKKQKKTSITKINPKPVYDEDPAYEHKLGHTFINSLVAGIRFIGAVIWCIYDGECEHNISIPITHLALTGFVPADIIVLVEFFIRKDRPYVLPLMHDVLGLIMGAVASFALVTIGNCNFPTKLARFVPTTVLICLILQFFHIIMFLATT